MSAPVWVLTLAGGVLADRADRRRVITGFQSVQMLCPMLIVALLLAGAGQPWMIIGLSLWRDHGRAVRAVVFLDHSLNRRTRVVQTSASRQLRGQAVSLYMLAMRGGGARGSLATGISVSLLGIRAALLINGMLAILVQVLIGRHSGHTPVPGNPDAPSSVRSPRRAA